MLSILIPSFDTDCSELLRELHQQCETVKIEFEIIVSDDASPDIPPELENCLQELAHAKLIIQPQNLGRSKNRNFLVDSAQFTHVIFIDGDSLVEEPHFIQNYLDAKDKADVVYGGTAYTDKEPKEGSRLRWHYGLEREAVNAATRQKRPYIGFKTNNFLSTKEFMTAHRFDEGITEYGHEDTIFGLRMLEDKDEVLHIDNPVLHDGIEPDVHFIEKTETGLQTLRQLELLPEYRRLLRQHHRMCSMAARFRTPIIGMPIRAYFKANQSRFKKKCLKNPADLRSFDLYRLSYYLSL